MLFGAALLVAAVLANPMPMPNPIVHMEKVDPSLAFSDCYDIDLFFDRALIGVFRVKPNRPVKVEELALQCGILRNLLLTGMVFYNPELLWEDYMASFPQSAGTQIIAKCDTNSSKLCKFEVGERGKGVPFDDECEMTELPIICILP